MRKRCKGCNKSLSLTKFYRQPLTVDGFAGKCKECTKAAVRANRSRNIEYYREYDKWRFQENKERKQAQRERCDQWRRDYPERYKAHNAVNNATRDGRLFKEPCRDCGEIENVHGHHTDYSKPLDVIWLCPPCHSLEHQRQRNEPEEKRYANSK